MMTRSFENTYGPWALVTGTSSGIGEAIAIELAKRRLNLALTARRQGRLAELSKRLESEFGVQMWIIAADIATREGIDQLRQKTAALDVGPLVNNAGREDSGRFIDIDPDLALLTLDLNTRAPLLLAHHFAGRMVDRGAGGIMFMSSIVAFQGVPNVSNYAATKAYDLVLAESLAAELAPHGTDVLAVAPGFTATELSPNHEFSGLPIKPMPAEKVASAAVEALGKRRLVVPGMANKVLYLAGKYLLTRRSGTANFGRVFKAVLRRKLSRDVGADFPNAA